MKVILQKADGTQKDVTPVAGKFKLKEMQDFVGGYIECIEFPDGRTLVVNEEGKLEGLPVNDQATALWRQQFPTDDDIIVGDVLIVSKDYPWNEE